MGFEHLHTDFRNPWKSLLGTYFTNPAYFTNSGWVPDMEMSPSHEIFDKLHSSKRLRSIDDSWNGS